MIDRELYFPPSWTNDPDRCAAAGVPDDIGFLTKPRWPPGCSPATSGQPDQPSAATQRANDTPAIRGHQQLRMSARRSCLPVRPSRPPSKTGSPTGQTLSTSTDRTTAQDHERPGIAPRKYWHHAIIRSMLYALVSALVGVALIVVGVFGSRLPEPSWATPKVVVSIFILGTAIAVPGGVWLGIKQVSQPADEANTPQVQPTVTQIGTTATTPSRESVQDWVTRINARCAQAQAALEKERPKLPGPDHDISDEESLAILVSFQGTIGKLVHDIYQIPLPAEEGAATDWRESYKDYYTKLATAVVQIRSYIDSGTLGRILDSVEINRTIKDMNEAVAAMKGKAAPLGISCPASDYSK
jgi:hypothetical protein